MSRIRKLLAVTAGVLALGATAAPVVQAQPLPGGSVELPPVEPIAVPVPGGSSVGQLPPLPFPLFWQDSRPENPQYVASNWVEPYSFCPERHQRAYAQDGTQLWCSRLARTDARIWAPHPEPVPYSPDLRMKPMTKVANSLSGNPCGPVGATATDPSNGQPAFCDWHLLYYEVPVWQYEPGS